LPDEAEAATIRAFVVAGRRERILGLLAARGGRAKVRALLHHFHGLDERFTVEIDRSQHTPEAIARLLRERGAPATCRVMCSDADLDGATLPLDEGLADVVAAGAGALLICLPGRLAFYEAEDEGVRFILERR
jgi:hypothetical protein